MPAVSYEHLAVDNAFSTQFAPPNRSKRMIQKNAIAAWSNNKMAFFSSFRKEARQEHALADFDRQLMNLSMSTVAAMKTFFENREVFAAFAGAVFALHQDTLRAYAVDMLKTDDMILGAALDKLRPSPLGDYPKRISLAIEALYKIDNANLDLFEKVSPPTNVSNEDHLNHRMSARLRSLAARVWLVTIYSNVKEIYKMPALTMWTMLQILSVEEILQSANQFTGSFYHNVRTDAMNLKNWPSAAN